MKPLFESIKFTYILYVNKKKEKIQFIQYILITYEHKIFSIDYISWNHKKLKPRFRITP